MSIQTSEQAELERLRAENAALRKDAERFRWVAETEWWFDGFDDYASWLANIDECIAAHKSRSQFTAESTEKSMQALVDQAQELDMGYGERK